MSDIFKQIVIEIEGNAAYDEERSTCESWNRTVMYPTNFNDISQWS